MNRTFTKLASILLIASMLLTGCGSDNKSVKQPELLTPVNMVDKTETVAYRDIYNLIQYYAAVVPGTEEISFSYDGIFDKFYVSVGDQVKKGQKLASQSNDQLENQLKELQSSYDQVQSAYDDAKKINEMDKKIIEAKLEKSKSLLKVAQNEEKKEIQYTINKLELDKTNIEESSALQYKDYEAQLALCKSQIDQVKVRMESNDVVAPCDGVVAQLSDFQKGKPANANYTVLKLYDMSKMYIKAEPEVLETMNRADKLYAIFNGKDYDITFNGKKQNSQVSNFGNDDDSNNFILKDSNTDLVYGDAGFVCTKFKNRENVLSITTTGLYSDGSEAYYAIRVKDGKKEKVEVEVGVITSVYVEILSGLEEGDVIMNE